MRYILCEDNSSGFYFWTFISKFVLTKEYQMLTVDYINKALGVTGSTIGIDKIYKYLKHIIKSNKIDINDIYIVCVDNASDNTSVQDAINNIDLLIGPLNNFHRINYICFEQLIIASPNVLLFIPNLIKLPEYSILFNHIQKYGLGRSMKLSKELKKKNIKFSNTERIHNDLLKQAMIAGMQTVGKRNYNVMIHHYIYKSGWSVCWTTDCTPNCPNDRCWEATGNNNLMCQVCNSNFKNKDSSCMNINNTAIRKFAEEHTCNKTLPPKLKDRFILLFGFPEILKIDTY